MQTDFLIVGQGLCGSWLSYYLLREGASVIVMDRGTAFSASSAASGIINPITGKRLARQWMGETILPFAKEAYTSAGNELERALVDEIAIHNFFSNADEAGLFERKAAQSEDEMLHFGRRPDDNLFNSHYGVGTIHPALLVDVRAFLNACRQRLRLEKRLLEEDFDWKKCSIAGDSVKYDDVHAKAVIDCSGAAASATPYFSRLPFALNKGEAIIASIPGLPQHAVYKYAQLSLVPWSEGRFWIGSTFDWDFTDEAPTQAFRQKAEAILQQWLRIPYKLEDHFAAIRPATVTRDAFSGMHPQFPRVGILNGMGSKGCSLAPFLAYDLARHLVHGTALNSRMDLARFARTLNRT